MPKLMVIYPTPTDVEAREKVYQDDHVPMAVEKIPGKTKLVATRVVGSPAGDAPYYRIAEVHFASMEDLQQAAGSPGAQETLAHAAKISTGGAPIVLIAEEGASSSDPVASRTTTARGGAWLGAGALAARHAAASG